MAGCTVVEFPPFFFTKSTLFFLLPVSSFPVNSLRIYKFIHMRLPGFLICSSGFSYLFFLFFFGFIIISLRASYFSSSVRILGEKKGQGSMRNEVL